MVNHGEPGLELLDAIEGCWSDPGGSTYEVTKDVVSGRQKPSCSVVICRPGGSPQERPAVIRLRYGSVSWGQSYYLDPERLTSQSARWTHAFGGNDFLWKRSVAVEAQSAAAPSVCSGSACTPAGHSEVTEAAGTRKGWDSPWDVFVKRAVSSSDYVSTTPWNTELDTPVAAMAASDRTLPGVSIPLAGAICKPQPPSASLETGQQTLKVNDAVQAFFYGEWHPAHVRSIDGDQIEVLWDAEWSVSKLSASCVVPVRPTQLDSGAEAQPCEAQRLAALPEGEVSQSVPPSSRLPAPPLPPPPSVPAPPAPPPRVPEAAQAQDNNLAKPRIQPPPPPPRPQRSPPDTFQLHNGQQDFHFNQSYNYPYQQTRTAQPNWIAASALSRPAPNSGPRTIAESCKNELKLYSGVVSSYRSDKKSGVISSDDARHDFGRDVYVFGAVLERGCAGLGDIVCFAIHTNAKGVPQASSPLLRLSAATGFALLGTYQSAESAGCLEDDSEDAVGSIICQDVHLLMTSDVCVHRALGEGLMSGSRVLFNARLNTHGRLEASTLKAVAENTPPPAPGHLEEAISTHTPSTSLRSSTQLAPQPPSPASSTAKETLSSSVTLKVTAADAGRVDSSRPSQSSSPASTLTATPSPTVILHDPAVEAGGGGGSRAAKRRAAKKRQEEQLKNLPETTSAIKETAEPKDDTKDLTVQVAEDAEVQEATDALSPDTGIADNDTSSGEAETVGLTSRRVKQPRQPARVAKPKKTMKQRREAKAAQAACQESHTKEDVKAEEAPQTVSKPVSKAASKSRDVASSSDDSEGEDCRMLCSRNCCSWKKDSEAAAVGVCSRCRRKLSSLEDRLCKWARLAPGQANALHALSSPQVEELGWYSGTLREGETLACLVDYLVLRGHKIDEQGFVGTPLEAALDKLKAMVDSKAASLRETPLLAMAERRIIPSQDTLEGCVRVGLVLSKKMDTLGLKSDGLTAIRNTLTSISTNVGEGSETASTDKAVNQR